MQAVKVFNFSHYLYLFILMLQYSKKMCEGVNMLWNYYGIFALFCRQHRFVWEIPGFGEMERIERVCG